VITTTPSVIFYNDFSLYAVSMPHFFTSILIGIFHGLQALTFKMNWGILILHLYVFVFHTQKLSLQSVGDGFAMHEAYSFQTFGFYFQFQSRL
jgi:hypothetical protein